ncbi:hypothetical protein ACFLXQ_04605 [Chloroflexota bacterium]
MAEKRKQPSDEEIVTVKEHLLYELQMLLGTAKILVTIDPSNENDFQTVVIYNALLESFSMHARVLLDFLYNDKPHKDDVVASDFFDPDCWFLKRPQKSPLLEKLHKNVNKRVAHLTYYRLKVKSKEVWEFTKIANEIAVIFGSFRDLVYEGSVSSPFYEFLEGIVPAHSFFPKDSSDKQEDDSSFQQGGVSLMPYPGITQKDFEQFWLEVFKDI